MKSEDAWKELKNVLDNQSSIRTKKLKDILVALRVNVEQQNYNK